MAKSNPKKEKAERNKAYARQFRKKTTRFNSKFKRRDYNNSNEQSNNTENKEQN
ncbi:hypothetical protein IQ215_12735 [Cyanobacterium stanieri LEGE 03274]|uniref:30S ribosomal protein S20 n=1 Tax=Cyanobacterium stanieri LEGE 03274 TaxID=1828756 RepID=A0ABR9V6R0_9CHRO|nr:hypothetical protein [Cyanobacterium stanieri]MBE9223563.1 hypothetical protein [Cyanobacterium stanieri LEGE 03274]